MNPEAPSVHDEAMALAAYRDGAQESPGPDLDARILQAAHAINATPTVSSAAGRMRRWSPLLATAAVAVLAVGITLRRPDPALERAPAVTPPAPVMQPAVQRSESARPSNRDMGLSGNAAGASAAKSAGNARDRAASAAADGLSRSVRESRQAGELSVPLPAAPEMQRRERSGSKPRVDVDPKSETSIYDEPLPMASPAPPPPPASAAAPTEPRALEENVIDSESSDRKDDSATSADGYDSLKSRASSPPGSHESEDSAAIEKPETDADFAASRSSRADAASAGSDEASRHRPQPQPQQEQAGASSAGARIAAVDAASIARGEVAIDVAIRAVRDAASRGEDARAGTLAAAATAHFGRDALPADVLVWAR